MNHLKLHGSESIGLQLQTQALLLQASTYHPFRINVNNYLVHSVEMQPLLTESCSLPRLGPARWEITATCQEHGTSICYVFQKPACQQHVTFRNQQRPPALPALRAMLLHIVLPALSAQLALLALPGMGAFCVVPDVHVLLVLPTLSSAACLFGLLACKTYLERLVSRRTCT